MQAGGLTLSARAQDVGEATEDVAASYEGRTWSSPSTRSTCTTVWKRSTVRSRLLTADKLKPALLRSPTEDNFLYVLMPLRIT